MSRWRAWTGVTVVVAASMATPAVALACPRCATAVEAREVALRDRPLSWLAVAAAPFAAMFALAAATARMGRPAPHVTPGDDP